MEFQNPPSNIARIAHSGDALASCWNMKRNESPPIELGLELGRGGSSQRSISSCIKPYGFTVLQLQELQIQSLIYKYVEAGFPVPYHLFFPIWKSVASSLGGLSYSSLYQLCPSFKGCNRLYSEYKDGIDPEPGRCRRTDGKKWRCSKDALPDQKYCDRHMHRGRQRPRKLVEAPSQSRTITSTNLSISLPGMLNSNASSGTSTIGSY